MFKTLAIAAFAVAAAFANVVAKADTTVQTWVLGTYTANAGETKDAFVLRVASVLKNWADTTGTEACGGLAKNADGALTITLITEKAQVVCVFSPTAPAGTTYVGESMHCHPPMPTNPDGVIALTDTDKTILYALGDHVNGKRSAHWVKAEPAGFSEPDYKGGPGYLVSQDKLLYQHGENTSTVIANL
jgi:hypothetical protein